MRRNRSATAGNSSGSDGPCFGRVVSGIHLPSRMWRVDPSATDRRRRRRLRQHDLGVEGSRLNCADTRERRVLRQARERVHAAIPRPVRLRQPASTDSSKLREPAVSASVTHDVAPLVVMPPLTERARWRRSCGRGTRRLRRGAVQVLRPQNPRLQSPPWVRVGRRPVEMGPLGALLFRACRLTGGTGGCRTGRPSSSWRSGRTLKTEVSEPKANSPHDPRIPRRT